jgi:uncharacterized RDD family membrane protein YckC
VDPLHGLRSMGKRITDPVEQLAEKTAERVIDLVVRTLDVNAVVQRVDFDAIVDRVDVNKVVNQVDVNKVVDQVDVEKILDQVDVNKVVDQVDVDKILDQVDLDKLVDRIDPDKLLDRIDVDRLLAKVDLNDLLARMDIDVIAGRVDINAIAERIDIDALALHTDIGAMIARSSGGIASEALDAVRSQAVGLDEWIARWVARLLRRDAPARRPHFGGAVSRFVAYVLDLGVSIGVFMLALAAISFAASIITGDSISWNRNDLPVAILFVIWEFVYFAYSWGASGKTLGMAVLGVRVVAAGGRQAGPRRAVIRTLAFPLSFLLLGLGFTGILFQRDRRALHDMIAGTAVVYAWDARAARLRFLDRPSPDELPPGQLLPGQPPVGQPLPGHAPLNGAPLDQDTPAELA